MTEASTATLFTRDLSPTSCHPSSRPLLLSTPSSRLHSTCALHLQRHLLLISLLISFSTTRRFEQLPPGASRLNSTIDNDTHFSTIGLRTRRSVSREPAPARAGSSRGSHPYQHPRHISSLSCPGRRHRCPAIIVASNFQLAISLALSWQTAHISEKESAFFPCRTSEPQQASSEHSKRNRC